jgi:sugar O-acyltransferase (sialic acid O-acetyltransferase NeuD family)
MKKLVIFGAGGLGRTVVDALPIVDALDNCKFVDWMFVDDTFSSDDSKRLCDPAFLSLHAVIVAIGNNQQRRYFCEMVLGHGGTLQTVFHGQAFVSRYAHVGIGTFVHYGAHVGSNARIGKGCIVNTNASVGHDCEIGDYVNICDGAILGGGVKVGDDAFIGLNATILPRARIGQGAFIAAGAVVIDHVRDGERVAGNPAKPIGSKSTAGPLPMNCDASSDSPPAPSDSGAAASPTQSDPCLRSGHK